uniref:Uncharacterized protein n=1 Tax=Tetranychus urticae TaxID=32264 RepID=T1K3P0_TETUR
MQRYNPVATKRLKAQVKKTKKAKLPKEKESSSCTIGSKLAKRFV